MTLERLANIVEAKGLDCKSKDFWKRLAIASRAAHPNNLSGETRYNLARVGYPPSKEGFAQFCADLKTGRVKRDEADVPQEAGIPVEIHQHKETTEFGENGVETLTVESTRLKTVEDIVAFHKIDLKKFIVSPIESTYWEVGMRGLDGKPLTMPLHRLKVRIAPIEAEKSDFAAMKREVLSAIEPMPSASIDKKAVTGILAEVMIPDLHLGKKPVKGKWDLKTAAGVYMAAVETFAAECERQAVERILLPVGNDYLHIDSSKGTTTAGTPVEPAESWGTLLAFGSRLLATAARRLSIVAPVDIVAVRGNHDADSTISIREILAATFEGNGRVRVLPGKEQRQAYVWGKNLIAHSHGDLNDMKKIAFTLPIEFPREFAATKYKFVRFGHLHRSQKDILIVPDHVENFGIEVAICPSLAPTDRWHSEMGFIGNQRRAKCFFYGKDSGLFLERTFSL